MELCIGTSSSAKVLLKLNSSRPSHSLIRTNSLSLSDPFLQFKSNRLSSSLTLPFQPGQSQFLQSKFSQSHGNSCRFLALASPCSTSSSSSSIAPGPETDKLPANLEVTETEEPKSRVSYLF